MIASYAGKAVLVTGGTAGIGLASALAFGRQGAQCTLTYRFGSADEAEVRARFAEVGAPVPDLIQSDAAKDEDTDVLLAHMQKKHKAIEALVVNVSNALITHSLDDYDRRGLLQSVEAGAWPMVEYTRRIRRTFGRYPRYIIGMSSTGPDHFAVGYDFVAASKAVMETLCRYMCYRLRAEDVRINVIRSRSVRTDAFEATFGEEFMAFAAKLTKPSHFLAPEEVGDAALALASGMMDGVNGQILTIDRGTTFFDDLMRLYEERETLGI